jgi:pyruvate dehydrogenase E2 component (dihydrolipoamide acetyltransferase)
VIEFRLPSLGADMDEGTLLLWNVAPGQAVKKGDVIAVVDTSKAAIDVECWHDGVVHRLVTEPGQTIPVGTVMALLLAPGEATPTLGTGSGDGVVEAVEPAAAPVVPARPAPVLAVAELTVRAAQRQRVSPAARQRAAELGVVLDTVVGSGADGAVTRDDVERAAASAAQSAPKGGPATMTPADRAKEMRKSIAAAMSRSKREIPHYYLTEPVPMRKALDWLRAANTERAVTARLLPAVLLLKAVALTLRDVPEMNGMVVDGVFRPSERVHIGVAISLRMGGLVAPALHDVDTKDLDALMRELADLVKRCRAGSLRSSEMSDPTVTVTNLGEQGAEAVLGAIYPPQVALVGFGRIGERPWVDGDRVSVMPALTASLAADHRVSDGHRGAIFLTRLRDWLQRPEELQGERDE